MTLDEFMALAGTSNTGAGEYVSSGTAESLPAVMNAVTVISEAVATMPCYLYLVRNEKGRPESGLILIRSITSSTSARTHGKPPTSLSE